MRRLQPLVPVLVITVGAACGNPPAPMPSPTPSATVITITAAGVSPNNVQIAIGGRIRFVNNDTREHEMGSDPHPDHTDCPVTNQVGLLKPGEQRETGNFVVVRTCGFHDHLDPDNVALRGSIVAR